MYSVWTFFLKHTQFTVLLMLALVFVGVTSAFVIPKESAPEVKVPIAIVVTPLPGASAADVESLVTNTLERPLKSNLDNLKNITSTSAEGSSSITVEFEADADLQVALNDLRDEVDRAKSELPNEAEDPQIIRIDFAAEPVVTFAIASDIPEPALFALGEDLEDELEGVSGVSSITISGLREREVQVLIDRARLATFNLNANDVVRAVSAANVSSPAGSIEVSGVEYPLRFEGDITSVQDVAEVPIIALDGAIVRVSDVATVVDGYAPRTSLARASVAGALSQPSLTLDVFKSSNADITGVSSRVRDTIDALQQPGELLDDVQVSVLFDRGELLFEDLSTLGFTGLQTTALVILMLAVAIGWREALIAGSAIPLSVLIALVVMNYTGNTLNFISLFSLVLAIGIIVDAAIVVVEGINTRMRQKSDLPVAQRGRAAAKKTLKEFHIPLTAGTMTTVAVFAPLFLVSGITGEFIKSIPFTIIAVLFASLLVSLGFIPLIAARFAGRSIGGFGGKRAQIIDGMRSWYRNYLQELLSAPRNASRLIFGIVLMLVFVFSLPAMGALRVVFFESGNEDFLYINIELPQGATLTRTNIELQKVEEELYTVPEIDSFTATVGRSSQFSGTQGASTGEKLANVFIVLDADRDRRSSEIADELRATFADFGSAEIRVGELESGPPSGAPVLVTFFGDDLDALENVARDTAGALARIPNTTSITTSTRDNETSFIVSFDRAQAMTSNIATRDAAGVLRTTVFGSTATKLRGADEDVDINVRTDLNGAADPDIANVTDPDTVLLTPIGAAQASPVLLGSFSQLGARETRASIRHEDGERIASVSADVTAGGNAREVTQALQAQFQTGELTMPRGVRMQIGGETEDVDQSFTDLFVALILGIIGIFAILVLQFNSFRYAGYVLMAVPLSLIGVFAGLLIADRPISFPSIMGFIALAGIVVNNAIIMIDTINHYRAAEPEKSVPNVVTDAAVSRLRPVILTTITTVVGVMPLMFTAEIWIPLALALMFGLTFATILTLVLIPAVYARWPGPSMARQ